MSKKKEKQKQYDGPLRLVIVMDRPNKKAFAAILNPLNNNYAAIAEEHSVKFDDELDDWFEAINTCSNDIQVFADNIGATNDPT